VIIFEHTLPLSRRNADMGPVWCAQQRAPERYTIDEMLAALIDLETTAERTGSNFGCG
jgi:hypothetical protein